MILERFAPRFYFIPFRKICFIYFRKFALFILGSLLYLFLESFLLGVAFCILESFFS